MDNMEFEEEIKDAEYFEQKIKSLEKRITLLEDKAFIFGDWPECFGERSSFQEDSIHQRAEALREYLKEEREKGKALT